MGCVLAREVWDVFLRLWGKLHWMPQLGTTLVSWLQEKKGGPGGDWDHWTATVLVCWSLWRHRNDVVFEGMAPSKDVVICNISEDAELWRAARLFRGILAPVEK
jgi:hypothetical protein